MIKWNRNFSKIQLLNFSTLSQNKLDVSHTRIHGHYRYDPLNSIKYDQNYRNSIVLREKLNFKKWNDYLNVFYRKWEAEVYKI